MRRIASRRSPWLTKPRRRGAVTEGPTPGVQAGPSPGGSGGGASAPCTATGRRGLPKAERETRRVCLVGGMGPRFGRGLPPITLYPVGALAPVHNPACTDREAWDGPDQSLPRGFCSQGQDRARGGHGSHPGRGERPFEGSLAVRSVQARFKTAPSGMTPVSRQRHSATASLRAMATMAMRRRRPFRSPTRSRNHLESALSGW